MGRDGHSTGTGTSGWEEMAIVQVQVHQDGKRWP